MSTPERTPSVRREKKGEATRHALVLLLSVHVLLPVVAVASASADPVKSPRVDEGGTLVCGDITYTVSRRPAGIRLGSW